MACTLNFIARGCSHNASALAGQASKRGQAEDTGRGGGSRADGAKDWGHGNVDDGPIAWPRTLTGASELGEWSRDGSELLLTEEATASAVMPDTKSEIECAWSVEVNGSNVPAAVLGVEASSRAKGMWWTMDLGAGVEASMLLRDPETGISYNQSCQREGMDAVVRVTRAMGSCTLLRRPGERASEERQRHSAGGHAAGAGRRMRRYLKEPVELRVVRCKVPWWGGVGQGRTGNEGSGGAAAAAGSAHGEQGAGCQIGELLAVATLDLSALHRLADSDADADADADAHADAEGVEVEFADPQLVSGGLGSMIEALFQGAVWPRSLALFLPSSAAARAGAPHLALHPLSLACTFRGSATLAQPSAQDAHHGHGAAPVSFCASCAATPLMVRNRSLSRSLSRSLALSLSLSLCLPLSLSPPPPTPLPLSLYLSSLSVCRSLASGALSFDK